MLVDLLEAFDLSHYVKIVCTKRTMSANSIDPCTHRSIYGSSGNPRRKDFLANRGLRGLSVLVESDEPVLVHAQGAVRIVRADVSAVTDEGGAMTVEKISLARRTRVA